MLLVIILVLCIVPGIALLAGPRPERSLLVFGLVLDLLGGLSIALDGLPSAHRFFSSAPLMPWRAIDQALAKFGQANDSKAPALLYSDSGFNELLVALRRFDREIPGPPTQTTLLLGQATLALYRVPIFAGSVTVGNQQHSIEPLAGVIVARRVGDPIVVGSEAAMRTIVDRYRLSWFVSRGLLPVIFGFGWQLFALLIGQQHVPSGSIVVSKRRVLGKCLPFE